VYGSSLQRNDLKTVQAELGIGYQLADGNHYQDVCPVCRRKIVALTQDGLWRAGVEGF
jgi:ribosomal protein L37AE/L43A